MDLVNYFIFLFDEIPIENIIITHFLSHRCHFKMQDALTRAFIMSHPLIASYKKQKQCSKCDMDTLQDLFSFIVTLTMSKPQLKN